MGETMDENGTEGELLDLSKVEQRVFAPGVYDDLDAAIYHASVGVSTSFMKRFAEAPAKALVPVVKTHAMARGTVTHGVCLEPHRFDQDFMVTDLKRISARERATQAEMERAGGRTLVKRDDYDKAQRMRDALLKHPVTREILFGEDIAFERSAYWLHEPTGLTRRMRADITRPDLRVIADLKITADASARRFASNAARMRYPWQAAAYQDGMMAAPGGFVPEAFVFIAVEPEPPFLIGCYEVVDGDVMGDDGEVTMRRDLTQAREEMEVYMARIAACMDSGNWPGYPDTIRPLDLPPWYRNRQPEPV